MSNRSIIKDYGYLWLTLTFFIFSLAGHWVAAWFTFVNEQAAHGQTVDVNEYLVQTFRDTMENWQSEFLQLIWQVGGLAYFWYLGSPQSKEGDDRKEEKLDEILRSVSGRKASEIIKRLDKKYPRS